MIPGYNIVRQDSSRPHGGVAVAIKGKYKFSTISCDKCYDFQNILLSVSLGSLSLDILCVYLPPPPNGKFQIQQLNNVFSKICNKNYIIVGDFNAHHIAWGCRNVDRRGNLIYNFVDTHNLVCLNDHTITTFAPFGQQGNVLDLAFASPSISSSCTLSVLDDLMSSNHFPLLVSLFYKECVQSHKQSSTHSAAPTTPSIHCLANLNYNKIDWSKFHDLCTHKFSTFTINPDPLVAYTDFIQILVDILLTFHTTKAMFCHNKKRQPLLWWNDVCSQAVQQAKIALDSFRIYPSQENYLLYKQFDAKKKKTLSEQKALGWANLCSSFNRMTSTKLIWDYIRKFKFAKLRTSSKSHFFDDTKNIMMFLDKITSSSLTCNFSTHLQYLFFNNSSSSTQWLTDPFGFHELQAALLNKKSSSPGPDYITYKVIQCLPFLAKTFLLEIYNRLWKKSIIPPDWKIQ
ncbi:uncharacterized protein LOC113236999 [Hyposmocoma kahamanoa]|uniref:uncharacterized protein LOC113236999 n=1 Tax=Hyposmocoma kahamanoa TaxID=1477025 RepID=UPI000E6D7768|nr:uncharacterized protein LOC113236999 [Hyposmocoma kahamanoa]